MMSYKVGSSKLKKNCAGVPPYSLIFHRAVWRSRALLLAMAPRFEGTVSRISRGLQANNAHYLQWAKNPAHFCANGPKQDTEVHAPAHAQNVSHLGPSAQKWTGFFAHGRWWALLARGLRHGRGSMGKRSGSFLCQWPQTRHGSARTGACTKCVSFGAICSKMDRVFCPWEMVGPIGSRLAAWAWFNGPALTVKRC